jgi:hypothetical protein
MFIILDLAEQGANPRCTIFRASQNRDRDHFDTEGRPTLILPSSGRLRRRIAIAGTEPFVRHTCSRIKGIPFGTRTVHHGAVVEGRRVVGAKVRFSVSIDPKTNEAVEQLAKRHKPELSKSYIVEYALVRLLGAMEEKQLNLPLVLED